MNSPDDETTKAPLRAKIEEMLAHLGRRIPLIVIRGDRETSSQFKQTCEEAKKAASKPRSTVKSLRGFVSRLSVYQDLN